MAESLYKLEKKIATTVMTLKLERETHVPDLMTRIRILPGIAVVGQKDKVARFSDGDGSLLLSIKFLPESDEIYKSLKDMSSLVKKLPGVKTIAVVTFNKRKITLKGKDFKFIIDLVTFRIIHFKNKKKKIRKFRKNQIQESYFFELKNFLNSNKRELVSYKSALKTQKTINQIQNF